MWSSDGTNVAQPTDLKLLPYRQCDQSSHVNFLSNQFGDVVHTPVQHPKTLLSLLRCDVYHGVEVDVLEDESVE